MIVVLMKMVILKDLLIMNRDDDFDHENLINNLIV